MRNFSSLTCVLFLVSSTVYAAPALKLDPTFGKVTHECTSSQSKASKRHVWIFKQWHLASNVDTKNTENVVQPPQTKNQVAIYRQLDQWISAHQLNAVYAEGCTGEIKEDSKLKYNGWTFQDLKKASAYPEYADVLTSIPLKLEAKHGQSLKTFCADDEALLRENNLALSDARGNLGFLTRLQQFRKDPARSKTYLDGVIENYKLPKSTTVDQAIARLKTELKSAVTRAQNAVEKRNQKVIEKISESKSAESAVVFGGLHAAGISKLLDSKGIGCTVVEPVGYPKDGQSTDEELMKKLDQALAAL